MGRAGRVNVKRKDSRNRDSNQPSAAALTHGCAQENKKLRRNVLDGADFVRDVLDSYLETCEITSSAKANKRNNAMLRHRGFLLHVAFLPLICLSTCGQALLAQEQAPLVDQNPSSRLEKMLVFRNHRKHH